MCTLAPVTNELEIFFTGLIIHSDRMCVEKRLRAAHEQLAKRGVPLASNQVHFPSLASSNYFPWLMNSTET